MEGRKKKVLFAIFLIVLGFRLFFAFQTEHFDPDAYFNIRQIKEISETGTPVFHDDLSYGGRILFFAPFFHYVMAFFTIFMPFALKIMPNVFASLMVFISYLISMKLTKNRNISLVAAFVSGFIPVFISKTVNSVSEYSLAIPLIFLMLYFIMGIKKNKYIWGFISAAFLVSITHQISFILVIGFIIYIILVKAENLEQNKSEAELMIFTIFLVLWITFLIFKNAFLLHGFGVIWQNLPEKVASIYFGHTDAAIALVSIGLLPLIGGLYIIYKYLFRQKDKNVYLLMSFALAIAPLLWMRLIQLDIGLSFLGIVFALLFAKYLELSSKYLQKTKAADLKIAYGIFFALFFITSILPSYHLADKTISTSPETGEVQALRWIKENTEENATVAGSIETGHMISAIGKRKNIMDANFLLMKNSRQRLNDLERIYSTKSEIESIELLNKYSVDYILLSEKIKEIYSIDRLEYAENEKCFELIYDRGAKVYDVKCVVRESK